MADDIGHFEPQHQVAAEPLVQITSALHAFGAVSLQSLPAAEGKSSGQRAIDLFNEAKAAGEEHVTAFLQTLELAVRQAREIVDGKEVYPAGVRDICEKLTEYSASRAQAIFSIMRPEGPSRPSAPFEAVMPSLEEADLEVEMAQAATFGRRAS